MAVTVTTFIHEIEILPSRGRHVIRIEAGPICEERFSLREFCHLNDNGFYALNYTEYLVEQVKTDPAL